MKQIKKYVINDWWVLLLDIVAVNASYYLALLVRFYVNNQLRPIALEKYLPVWANFTPIYTILSIIVFFAFRLYGGMWRYAGINDMNRIIFANISTAVIHAAGTALFYTRMPYTYYLIGSFLQFVLVVVIRFGYRALLVEKKKITTRNMPASNVLVIGTGELGRRVIRDCDDDTAFKPVCVLGSGKSAAGRMIDGIPIVGEIDEIEKIIEKYKIQNVFIADNDISPTQRSKIRGICSEKKIEVQDYTGVLSNQDDSISVTALLELANCPILIRTGDGEQEFESSREALRELTDRYGLSSITVENGRLVLDLRKTQQVAFSLEDEKTVAYVGYDAWSKDK